MSFSGRGKGNMDMDTDVHGNSDGYAGENGYNGYGYYGGDNTEGRLNSDFDGKGKGSASGEGSFSLNFSGKGKGRMDADTDMAARGDGYTYDNYAPYYYGYYGAPVQQAGPQEPAGK
jgi:hypothetical protein